MRLTRNPVAPRRTSLAGGGAEVYEPRFTFHGFRYVELTGFPGTPELSAVTGRVMGTAAPFTGELPFNRLDEMVYEYACHEGNYAMTNILGGERSKERREAEQKKQQ